MRIEDLFEHGRIVPGVNTTKDVGPGEIPRQAKKWGWNLTKDGVPVDTLWSSVKPRQVQSEK